MSTLKVSSLNLNAGENTKITVASNDLDLAISANGKESIRVDSNGRVGFGISNPSSNLHVIGTANISSSLRVLGEANVLSTIRDSKGDVRDIPINNQTGSYFLTLSDTGKTISVTTGNVFVSNAIFSAGQAVSIYNNSASSITITQNSSVTIYLAGTSTTGNRTLAQRGVATMLCVAANTFVISGAGLT